MTKGELIASIADDSKLTKADAERAMNSFLNNIVKTLKKDGKLTLTGFGTFEVVTRQARKGRNPQTGDVIQIKARKSVKFKPGQTLKDQF